MNRVSRLLGLRLWALIAALPAALVLSACGGDDSSGGSDTFTGEEVVAAFEKAAGGYEFEEATTLVEGDVVAYAPKSSSDPTVVEPLNKALGEGSVLWQVVVFEGSDPPTGEEAVKEVAFASGKLEEAEDGVYIGDSDIAYVVNGNVVANGPALDGNPDDETLKAWQSTLDSL